MTKQSMPAVSTLAKDTIEEFKTADKVVLVAFFDKDDKVSNETYTAVANTLRDNYLFAATNDAALAKAEDVKQPAIVLYKSFDEGKDVFSEKFDKEAIEQFTKTAATPLVGEVGPETYAGYINVRPTESWNSWHWLTFAGWYSPCLHLRRDRRRARGARQGAQVRR